MISDSPVHETESRTLHFDLSHIPAGTEFWLSAGASDYPLVAHTEDTRNQARATNRALALAPPERITHYVKDLQLPTKSPQLLMVHSASRTGGKLPTMELTHIHLPRAARQNALKKLRAHPEHPAQARPLAKLTDHGVAPEAIDDPVIVDVHDWATAMDAAVTLIFFHMEILNLDVDTAAIAHLQIEFSNGISDLAASILRQARDHARNPSLRNYVYESSYLDPMTMLPNGEPCYSWTETTTKWAQGPMLASVRSTKNDPFLQATSEKPGLWSVQPGTTWAGVEGMQGAQAEKAPTPESQPKGWSLIKSQPKGWSLVNLTAGHGLQVGDLTFDNNYLTLPLKNDWLRWLSVYVEFLDAEGKPYDPPDWVPIPPGPDFPTKKSIGLMASAATIFAVPLPSSFEDIAFPMPSGASKVNYFAGGLGRVNGINGVGQWDSAVCAYGTAMTAIFNLGIPTIGLVAGFTVSLTELNAIAKSAIKELLIAIRLLYAESAASTALRKGDAGMWLALANALVMATIAAVPALAFWIIAKFSEAVAKKAAPIIGWIATAVSSAADAALLIQTSVAVAESPATFTLTAERKMNIELTMLPDVNHQNQWPATATHYRVSAQYSPGNLSSGSNGFVFNAQYDDNGTKTLDFPMKVMEGPIPLLIEDAPAGGMLTLIASFYSNTNWLCGHYKSAPMAAIPGANNTLVVPAFNITEELVPLNAATYYAPKLELVYKDGSHQWSAGRFDIKNNVSTLTADLDSNAVTPPLQKAFLENGKIVLSSSDQVITTRGNNGKGDQWLIVGTSANYHVNLILPAGAPNFLEVTPGNAGTVKDLNGSNVGHNLATLVQVTLNQNTLRLGYTWQASGQNIPLITGGGVYNGQMFTFQDASAGGHPETGLKFVPKGFPTRPVLVYDLYGSSGEEAATYYIDPRDDLYHVRKVDLTQPGPFDLSQELSYGRFNQQIDNAAIHPNGYLVGFNIRNRKLEVLPLLKKPVAGPDVPKANLYSGDGSRPGLLQNPVALAVTPDGLVLLLENATDTSLARIQAMDYLADPVNAFNGKTSSMLILKTEAERVTHLDIASEVGGHIYVLKYLGQGYRVQDYRLDIYRPDGTFVSQTVAVNAGRLCVSLWREMFTLNFTSIIGPDSRTEPSVSEWIPSTPKGAEATLQASRFVATEASRSERKK